VHGLISNPPAAGALPTAGATAAAKRTGADLLPVEQSGQQIELRIYDPRGGTGYWGGCHLSGCQSVLSGCQVAPTYVWSRPARGAWIETSGANG
jgi:hypothetical protein